MTVQELKHKLSDPNFLLIDVRENYEYNGVHLTPSIHIPLQTVPSRLAEIPKHKELGVICHHGIRSMSVVNYLTHLGYTNVHNVEGGIDLYALEIDASFPRY